VQKMNVTRRLEGAKFYTIRYEVSIGYKKSHFPLNISVI